MCAHVKKLTWGNHWTTALPLVGKGTVVTEKSATQSTMKVPFPPWPNIRYMFVLTINNFKIYDFMSLYKISVLGLVFPLCVCQVFATRLSLFWSFYPNLWYVHKTLYQYGTSSLQPKLMAILRLAFVMQHPIQWHFLVCAVEPLSR
jgi:hypothetical protein